MNALRFVLAATLITGAQSQTLEVVKVASDTFTRAIRLPGELAPYQSVDLRARVDGFVETVSVDRGSMVRGGDLLAALAAPEMEARIAEAEAKTKSLEAQQAELKAKSVAAEAAWQHLKTASETPGVIAGSELVAASKALEAARAAEQAAGLSVKAALASVNAMRTLQSFLQVKAPFDGVITQRYMHPGALAGPAAGPLLRLEQHSTLRLVVAVPESAVAGIAAGARIPFTVPAYPGENFAGTVSRISRSLDPQTRTMAVELDVRNPNLRLSPGMYAEVQWSANSGRRALLVPPSSVASTSERTFVIRVREGKAEWVNVRTGVKSGAMVEVFGPLQPGEEVILKASDEIRNGAAVSIKAAAK